MAANKNPTAVDLQKLNFQHSCEEIMVTSDAMEELCYHFG